MRVYRVPEEEQAKVLAFIQSLDIKAIATEVMYKLFAMLEMKYDFKLSKNSEMGEQDEKTIIQYPACSVHGALSCADHGIYRERDGRNTCMHLRNGTGRNNECRVPYLQHQRSFGGKLWKICREPAAEVKNPSWKERNSGEAGQRYAGYTIRSNSSTDEWRRREWHRCSSAGVAIDNTNFPDANFRSFVASSFDEDNDNYLSDTEINAAENINCAKKGISDLTGISHFTALSLLNASITN